LQVSSIVSRKNALEGRERQELGKGLYVRKLFSRCPFMTTLQATHGAKGRNFLTRWKGEDLNYKFPLLYIVSRKACGGTGEAATVAIFWDDTQTHPTTSPNQCK
jgi:hypothetical protein